MTSTPLTSIEGALALPSLRPHGPLSEPFGHEWALLRTGQRWQAGLDSLYAALLRTVCIRHQQLLSYGQRVSIDGLVTGVKRPAQAPVAGATQPAAVPANPAAAARPDRQWVVRQGPVRIALKARSPRIAQRRAVWHRRMVAASAGVIGCIALLAWWMVDQPVSPQHMAARMLKSAHALMARRDARVPVAARGEKRHGQHQGASPEAPLIAEVVTPASALPPSPDKVSAAASAIAVPPRRAPARQAPAPRDALRSPAARRMLRAQAPSPAAARQAANESSHGARVRTRSGEDEYADVAAFATMSLRDDARPPRATVSTNWPVDSTEWMNHMSQRRVTEIPEQFAH